MLAILNCRNGGDRGRLLDLSSRLRPAVSGALACYAVALGVALPSVGLRAVLPALAVLGAIWLLQARLAWFARPELVVFSSLVLLQLAVGAGIAMAGGPRIYYLSAFILPSAMGAVILPRRAAIALTALSGVIMIAVAFGFAGHEAINTPFAVIFPLVYLVITAISSSFIGETDVAIRTSAVVDELTGLLNRVALDSRIAELEHQLDAAASGIAIVIVDVDEFKRVNDEHGHKRGDSVLIEVADRIRLNVPSVETAYRLAGDEFLVLLPAIDGAAAARVAGAICAAISAEPITGIHVTASVGVSAIGEGERFTFASLFGRADAALYRAKREGRGRVRGLESSKPAREPSAGSSRDQPPGDLPTPPYRDIEVPSADSWQSRLAELHEETGSRLVQDDLQRKHLLRLNRRFRERNALPFGLACLCGFALATQYGWMTVVPPVIGMIVYLAIEHSLDRVRRPEYWLGGGWLVMQTALFGSAFFVNRPADFALLLGVALMVSSSAMFPAPAVVVGVAWTAAGTTASAFVMDAHFIVANPAVLTLVIALEASVGLVGMAVGRSTLDFNKAVVVDRLTGTFTRTALEARVAELAHGQGDQVAVVVADLDWFKSINDRFGHAAGDAVLTEVGRRIRFAIRRLDSAYRVGGEEFVLLLPRVGLDQANEIAERVRAAVNHEPAAGHMVSMSLGVAVSDAGDGFDYGETFLRADGALYRAKDLGRNRVECDRRDGHAGDNRRGEGGSLESVIAAA